MYKDYSGIGTEVTGISAINQSIKNILSTRLGSVPGKPEFGSQLYEVIFEPIHHVTITIIKSYIEESIFKFEPRITILDIAVKELPEFNRIIVTLTYSFRDKGLIQDSTVNVTFNR